MKNTPKLSLPVLLLSIAAIIVMIPVVISFMLVMFIYLALTKRKLKKEFSQYFNKNKPSSSSYTGGRTIDQDNTK